MGGLGLVAFRALDSFNEDPTAFGDPPTVDGPAAEDPVSTDPFAGTPAAAFADGEEGITLPAAEAVGDFSQDEVAGALEQVRAAMIATRIDQQMLVDRDPGPFLQLMSEANRDFLQQDFEGASFGYFASQLADGSELAVATPRVDGQVSYEATLDSGGIRVVEVVTSFVWAYAFVVPDGDPELDGIVVVRDELVWHLPHEDDVIPEATGLWLWEGEAYAWGIDCDAFDQGFLAPQRELSVGFDGPEEGEVFDSQGSLDIPSTC
jgi:hypothetical protein